MGQLWQIEVMRASALELENGRQDDSEKPAIATLVEDHVPEIKKPLRKIGRPEASSSKSFSNSIGLSPGYSAGALKSSRMSGSTRAAALHLRERLSCRVRSGGQAGVALFWHR